MRLMGDVQIGGSEAEGGTRKARERGQEEQRHWGRKYGINSAGRGNRSRVRMCAVIFLEDREPIKR